MAHDYRHIRGENMAEIIKKNGKWFVLQEIFPDDEIAQLNKAITELQERKACFELSKDMVELQEVKL